MKTLKILSNIRVDKKILENLKKEEEKLKRSILENFGINEEDLEILLSWARECFIKNTSPDSIPFGDYINHSWAGYSGKKVEGELLVLRDKALYVIEFYNNVFQYSDNGTLEPAEYDHWDDGIEDGDIILGHKWVETHYEDDDVIDEFSEKVLYKKPYVYCKNVKDKIANLKTVEELLKEWLS